MFFQSILILLLKTVKAEDATVELFLASRFDPVNDNETLDEFMAEHVVKTEIKTFGDLSVVTLNLAGSDDDAQSQAQAILELIDSTHPSVLGLQGCTQEVLDEIFKTLVLFHYQVTNIDESSRDALTGEPTLVPVIYDSQLLSVKNNGYFRTNEKHKQVYASYVEFLDKRIERYYKSEVSFLVINADIFSTFNDVVSAMFFNILNDISEAGLEKIDVFFLGNMGTVPGDVKRVIELSYKNLLDADHNNKGLQRKTDHTKDNDDNIQRDFVLLKDVNDMFIVNYARILSKFPYLNKYPVQGIVTIKQKVKELAEEKSEEKRQEKQLVESLIDKRVAEKSEQIASGEVTEDEIKEEVREEVRKVSEAKEEASERKEEAKRDFEIQKAAEHTEKVKQEMMEQGISKAEIQNMEATYEESAEERRAAVKKEKNKESLSCAEEELRSEQSGSENESRSGRGDFYSLDTEDGEANFRESRFRSETGGSENESFDLEDGSRRYGDRSEDDSEDGAKRYRGSSRHEETEEGSTEGSIEGNAEGSTEGSLEGSSTGSSGSLEGSTEGSVEGSVSGSIEGSSTGSVEGSGEGNVEGSRESAENEEEGSVKGSSSSGSSKGGSGSSSTSGSSTQGSEGGSSNTVSEGGSSTAGSQAGSSTRGSINETETLEGGSSGVDGSKDHESISGETLSQTDGGVDDHSNSGKNTDIGSTDSQTGTPGDNSTNSAQGSNGSSTSSEGTDAGSEVNKETQGEKGDDIKNDNETEITTNGGSPNIETTSGNQNEGTNKDPLAFKSEVSVEPMNNGSQGEDDGANITTVVETGYKEPKKPEQEGPSIFDTKTGIVELEGGNTIRVDPLSRKEIHDKVDVDASKAKHKREEEEKMKIVLLQNGVDPASIKDIHILDENQLRKPVQNPLIKSTIEAEIENKKKELDAKNKIISERVAMKNKEAAVKKQEIILNSAKLIQKSVCDLKKARQPYEEYVRIQQAQRVSAPVSVPTPVSVPIPAPLPVPKPVPKPLPLPSPPVQTPPKPVLVPDQQKIAQAAGKIRDKIQCSNTILDVAENIKQDCGCNLKQSIMDKTFSKKYPSQNVRIIPANSPASKFNKVVYQPGPHKNCTCSPNPVNGSNVMNQRKGSTIPNQMSYKNTSTQNNTTPNTAALSNTIQKTLTQNTTMFNNTNSLNIPTQVVSQPKTPIKAESQPITPIQPLNTPRQVASQPLNTPRHVLSSPIAPIQAVSQPLAPMQQQPLINPPVLNTQIHTPIPQPTIQQNTINKIPQPTIHQNTIMKPPLPQITTPKVIQPQISTNQTKTTITHPPAKPQYCPCKTTPQKNTIIHKTRTNKEELPDLKNKKTTHTKELMVKMVQKDLQDKFKGKHLMPGITITTKTITNGPVSKQLKKKEAPILCQNMQIDKMTCEQADQLVKRAEEAYKEVVLNNFQEEINRAKEAKEVKQEFEHGEEKHNEVKKEEVKSEVKKEEVKSEEKSEEKHEVKGEEKKEEKKEGKPNVKVTRTKFRVPGGTITPEKPKEQPITIDDILNK